MSEPTHPRREPRANKVNAAIAITGTIALVFVIFALGIYVGYRKAMFASDRGASYDRSVFGGTPPWLAGGMPGSAHGVIGTVVDVATTSLVVEDGNSDEEWVEVPSTTIIRMYDRTMGEDGMQVGERVVVIGQPGADGEIQARFIRVFPATSSPPGTQFGPMSNASNVIIIHTF